MKSKNPELDLKLDELAIASYDHETKTIKEAEFVKLLKFVRPYIAGAVKRSTWSYDEDWISILDYETYRVLKQYGPTPNGEPFSVSFKLRIQNILTNNWRNKIRPQIVSGRKFVPLNDITQQNEFVPASDQFNSDFETVEMKDLIESLISLLPAREKRIVMCFIYKNGDFGEVSKEVGLTECYIRKVLRNISELPNVRKLRRELSI